MPRRAAQPGPSLLDWPMRQRLEELARRRVEILARISRWRPRSERRRQAEDELAAMTREQLEITTQLRGG